MFIFLKKEGERNMERGREKFGKRKKVKIYFLKMLRRKSLLIGLFSQTSDFNQHFVCLYDLVFILRVKVNRNILKYV